MKDPRTLSDIGESGWLDLLYTSLQELGSDLVIPIGDDAAVRRVTPGMVEIVTSDAMVEGTHFKMDWLDWAGLARRSVLAAASDISAMGGMPHGFLLSVGLPPETRVSDLESFVDSISHLCRETGMVPYGGDTAKSQTLFVDVTVIGEVEPANVLRQSGAEPGDALWVTGALGAARAEWMSHEEGSNFTGGMNRRFWSPPIRWTCLPDLRAALDIRSATDLSDGLALDIRKLLRGQSVGASIQLKDLPIDQTAADFCARKDLDPLEFAFLGGEDFELLIVEKGSHRSTEPFLADGVPVTKIGVVTNNAGEIERLDGDKIRMDRITPFEHFPPIEP